MQPPSPIILSALAVATFSSCVTDDQTSHHPSRLEQSIAAHEHRGFAAPKREIQNGSPNMIHVTAKVIDLETVVLDKHESLTERKYQTRLRKLAQTKGADLLSAPSIVARPNQTAQIEVIRELALRGNAFDKVENVGVTIEIEPAVLKNGSILLAGKATVRGVDPAEVEFEPGNLAVALHSNETYFDAAIKRGHTLQLVAERSGSPGQRVIFLTAKLIDPAGQPIR